MLKIAVSKGNDPKCSQYLFIIKVKLLCSLLSRLHRNYFHTVIVCISIHGTERDTIFHLRVYEYEYQAVLLVSVEIQIHIEVLVTIYSCLPVCLIMLYILLYLQ